jgi:hypothetical protein
MKKRPPDDAHHNTPGLTIAAPVMRRTDRPRGKTAGVFWRIVAERAILYAGALKPNHLTTTAPAL